MPLTVEEQEQFEDMFQKVLDAPVKSNKEKMEKLSDLLFELTGNVNLRMWLSKLKVS
jgi:hypothetical protein